MERTTWIRTAATAVVALGVTLVSGISPVHAAPHHASPWPACDPAVAPHLGYASNQSDGTIAVVDLTKDKVVGLMKGFDQPWNLNVTPDGRKLYVDDVQPLTPSTASIKVVDTCTQRIIRRFPTDGVAIAAMPKHGHELATAVYSHQQIEILNTATDTVVERYDTSTVPLNVVADETGQQLWVAGIPNVVFSIDRRSGRSTEKHAIKVAGVFPQQLALSPDESLVTAADMSGVTLIDTRTHTVRTRVELPGELSSAAYSAFSHDGRYLWTAYFSGQVAVVDTTTGRLVHLTQTGGMAIGLTFSRDGSKVYVSTTPPGSIIAPLGVAYSGLSFTKTWKPGGLFRIYDAKTFAQIGTFPMGNVPQAMAIPGSPK